MAYPFFSLAKTHRTTPIDYRMNDIAIRVEAVPEHGMATIWDADVLIWAASQIVQARDSGLRTSRLMAATPYEILTFIGRGTSARDYHRLKAALRPLAVHHRRHLAAPGERAAHAPLLLDQRMDRARRRTRQRRRHRSHRAGLVLSRRPRRRARADDRPRVFRADGRSGALALPSRAQARRQAAAGWRFDFRHLYMPSRRAFRRSSASPSSCATSPAASLCRAIASASIARAAGRELLAFVSTASLSTGSCGQAVDAVVLSGTARHVPSGTASSCYQEPKAAFSSSQSNASAPPNLESNRRI